MERQASIRTPRLSPKSGKLYASSTAGRSPRLAEFGTLSAARQEKLADPYRLAWARARVRLTEGKLDEADGLLAPIDSDGVILDLRVPGVVVRAVIADQQGRRDDAIKLYRRAQSLLDANPRFRIVFVEKLVTARAARSADRVGHHFCPTFPISREFPTKLNPGVFSGTAQHANEAAGVAPHGEEIPIDRVHVYVPALALGSLRRGRKHMVESIFPSFRIANNTSFIYNDEIACPIYDLILFQKSCRPSRRRLLFLP